MEESELIALEKRCVVVDDSLRELRHGGCCRDGERAEGHAADQLVIAVLGHADAGQRTTRNLVGREDGAAVELHPLCDIDLDYTEVGLDEGVVDRHVRRQLFEATAQHRVELLVDGAEVSPLGADVHLALRAQRCDRLDGGFADDSAHLGLTVDILTYLAANLSVDSENFCHCVLLFNVIHFVCSSSWRVGMCTYRLALKDEAKVQGRQKSNSGIAGLRGDKRGYGRIQGDMGWKLEGCRRGKTEGVHPDFGKKWGEWDNKKAAEKRLRSFMGVIPKDYINESLLIFVPLKNGRVHRRLFQQLHLRKSPYVFFRQLLSHEKITP